MKLTKQLLFSLFLLLFIASCTDDDSNDSDDGGETVQENPLSGDFFPSNANNEWNYDVENKDNETSETRNSTDRLFVETPTTNTSAFTLDVNDNSVSNGTMSGILTNGSLSKTDLTLSTTGQLAFAVDGLEDINIPYSDAVLYHLDAPDGSELSSFEGTITQEIESFPVTINYTLKTNQVKNWTTIEIDGETYNDVTQSTFVLTIAIDIAITSATIKPVVDEQESLIITNYFGKDIGLIKTEANTAVTPNSDTITLLEGIPGIDTSQIPSNISTKNTQILTSYTVN